MSGRSRYAARIVDTSALLAYFNAAEPRHVDVRAAIESSEAGGELVVSPYVIAELDYLVATRVGVQAETAVLRELAGGAWECPAVSASDLAVIASVVERYSDQEIGVTDASLVLLAQRYETRNVVTLDRRHFDVVRPLPGGKFRVLP